MATTCPACGAANDPEDRFCGDCGADIGGFRGCRRWDRRSGRLARTCRSAPGRRPPERPARPSAGSSASCSPISSASRPSPTTATRRPSASSSAATSTWPARSWSGTAARSRSSSATRSWPSGARRRSARTTRSAPCAPRWTSWPRCRASPHPAVIARRHAPAVLTGEAAAVVGAQGQGMVAGDLVNTASRLQAAAPPGTVLVGEATLRAAGEAIVFEAAGEQLLRGKTAPVPAWRAVRVVAGRRGAPAEAAGSSRRSWAATRSCSSSRISSTRPTATGAPASPRSWGWPGSGRAASRGSWRSTSTAWRPTSTGIAAARRRTARGLPSGPSARWSASGPASPRATTRRRRARSWRPRFASTSTTRRSGPGWSRASRPCSGSRRRPAGEREEFEAACRTLFERISERGTVVLVFEELQWADPALLDFIETITDRSRARPILVVTLSRPDLLERRPTWGAGLRSFSNLPLDPLAPDEVEMLLVGLAPGLPATAIAAIVERAEGIPLYAVEMVRMLLDQGVLREREGRYHLDGELGPLAIPGTLAGLLGSRLDGLTEPERHAHRARGGARPLLHRAGAGGGDGALPGAPGRHARRARAQGDPRPRGGSPLARSGASTTSSRGSSARSPTSGWPGATGWPGTWPRRATSRSSTTLSWPGS